MLDWITHIWSKPLSAWTLLDLVGIAALFFAVGIGWLIIMVTHAMTTEWWRTATTKQRLKPFLWLAAFATYVVVSWTAEHFKW